MPKSNRRKNVRRYVVETLEGRALLSGGLRALEHAAQVLRLTEAKAAHTNSLHQTAVSVNFTHAKARATQLRNILSIPEKVAGGQVTPTVKNLTPTSFPGTLTLPNSGPSQLNLSALSGSGIGSGPKIVSSNTPDATPVNVTVVSAPATTVAAITTPVTTTAISTPTVATPTMTTATTTVPMTGPVASPINSLSGQNLTATDVSSLKSAVDAYSTAYTGGTSTSADSAALTTFHSAMSALNTTIFSENHVVSPANVSALQQAVNSFATNYTSGTNLSTDTAAWTSLMTALNTFGSAFSGPQGGGGMGGPGMNGAPLTGIVESVISSGSLSKTQATTLDTAIDSFASTYTAGKTPATDSEALNALSTSLMTLSPNTPPPAPLPGGMMMSNLPGSSGTGTPNGIG